MTSSFQSFRPIRMIMASNFFTCKACASRVHPRDTLSRLLHGLQSQSIRRLAARAGGYKGSPTTTKQSILSRDSRRKAVVFSPLENLGRRIATHAVSVNPILGAASGGTASARARTAFFPATTSRIVGYWLLGSAASVYGIVVFGGLTRLTESG